MQRFLNNLKQHKLLVFIIIILFIVPFFWLKPDEIDLGGDSSRLYFYDPLSYTTISVLYSALPTGVGFIDSGFYSALPQMVLLIVLDSFLHSPYLLITVFNIAKLVIGFLAIYSIIKELISVRFDKASSKLSELASILAGLFYILSRHMVSNYDTALLYHNQIFLNPLMFYLFLKYLLTKDSRYGAVILIISFIFSSSFGFLSSPPFFAFYPLAGIFLLLYVTLIRHTRIPWKGLFFGSFLFLGLHAFHIIPIVLDIFHPGSQVNIRLLNKESLSEQVGIFYGILQLASINKTLFLPSWEENLRFLSIFYPLVIILGFLFNKKRDKTILLTAIFFLITFFLLTAKITQAGIEFYSRLFYIPGFAMFRNFTGIWTYVYSFFYTLLFGQAIFFLFKKLPIVYIKCIFWIGIFVLVLGAWTFIDGTKVNPIHYQSKGVKTAIVMDPLFEETLRYVKSLPNDSKLFTLPFTDCCMQVLFGTNNAAYMGPSMIGYLAGKSDFTGYANAAPFSELFFNLARKKDYASFKQMLGLLNVQYIFHNSDARVLDNFPIYPFSPDYVRKYFPNDQKRYTEFVKNLSSKKVFENNFYGFYLLDEKYFLPHFYIPKKISFYSNDPSLNQTFARASSFLPSANTDKIIDEPRVIFVERQWCKTPSLEKICVQPIGALNNTPHIFFEKINRTKYTLKISGASHPYILVFSEVFNSNWRLVDPAKNGDDLIYRIIGNFATKIVSSFMSDRDNSEKKIVSYFNNEIIEGEHANIFLEPKTFETWGKKEIAHDRHFEVNGYANAWYIRPEDMEGSHDYEFIVEQKKQRALYVLLPVSLGFFMICIILGFVIIGRFITKKT